MPTSPLELETKIRSHVWHYIVSGVAYAVSRSAVLVWGVQEPCRVWIICVSRGTGPKDSAYSDKHSSCRRWWIRVAVMTLQRVTTNKQTTAHCSPPPTSSAFIMMDWKHLKNLYSVYTDAWWKLKKLPSSRNTSRNSRNVWEEMSRGICRAQRQAAVEWHMTC